MFLMLTSFNCLECEKLGTYQRQLAAIDRFSNSFRFGFMNIDQNNPKGEFRDDIYNKGTPQFYIVKKENDKVRFDKQYCSFDEMWEFLENSGLM